MDRGAVGRVIARTDCGAVGCDGVECEVMRCYAMEFGAMSCGSLWIAAVIPEAGGELVGRSGRLDLAHP